MKWTNDRSDNVEDRRGKGGGRGMMIGGGLGTIVMVLVVMFLGGDPSAVLNNSGVMQGQGQTEQRELTEEELKTYEFVRMVTAETEETWTEIFEEHGLEYRKPKVVMFEQVTQSGCGTAQAAMGPFYCPADETIYMDMSFFNELQSKYGAKVTEFSVAYVMAHEVGHHVQNLLGTLQKSDKMRRSGRFSEAEINKNSVAVELQADFYAGVWAHHNKKYLDADDIDEAISAAHAVGDDAIQKRMQGHVVPDSFTHGTSEQRKYWFTKGYNTGDIRQGNIQTIYEQTSNR